MQKKYISQEIKLQINLDGELTLQILIENMFWQVCCTTWRIRKLYMLYYVDKSVGILSNENSFQGCDCIYLTEHDHLGNKQ